MNAPLHHTPGGGTSADSPPRRSSSSPQHLSTDDNCNNSNNSKHCNSNSNNNNSMTVGDSSTSHQPMRNYDGTEMRDASSRIVYKSQFLTTHPLRTDCKERVGYGGKKFTYVSGDGVIRTMNAIFGHGGWSTQITMERCVLNEKDERGRWCVGYLASVKVTLLQNGVSHEDCGSGEGIDNSKIKSHEKALKSAITDAMKRATRHFGERMGNALYVKGNSIRTAPRTNKDALAKVEREDALSLFGDQAVLRANYENESNNSNNNNNNLQSPEKKKLGPNNTVNTIVAVGGSSMSSNSNNNNSGVQKEHHNRSVVGQTTAGTNSYRNRPSPTNIVVASSTNTSSNNSANQMDNRPQNPQSRMAGQHAAAAPNAYHNRQPPNNVVVGQHHQQQEPTSLGEASTNKKHNNVNSGAQKENWPQNRMPGQNIVAEQNSYHNRVSPNNLAVVGQQHQQQPTTSFGSAVLPSPIASNGHRAGSMAQQNHGVVVRPGNPSTASDNSNNNMHHHQHQQPQPPQNNINLMNAPQPPSNLMAPPPRPMYNPHGGTTQYNSRGGGGGGGGILNNNNNNNNRGDKRRSLDAGVSSHNNNNGGNNSNMNNNNNSIGASYMDGNNNINSNNNGDNNAKRKKGNPYNNSNKRMSV